MRWLSARKANIDLLRAGKVSAAMDNARDAGDVGKLREELEGRIAKMDGFARDKAEGFYRNAVAQHRTLSEQLIALVAVILLLTAFILWHLLRAINGPLRQLKAAAVQLRQGKMNARSGYVSANEFGVLSASFNAMADAVQTEMLIEQHTAEVARVMLR